MQAIYTHTHIHATAAATAAEHRSDAAAERSAGAATTAAEQHITNAAAAVCHGRTTFEPHHGATATSITTTVYHGRDTVEPDADPAAVPATAIPCCSWQDATGSVSVLESAQDPIPPPALVHGRTATRLIDLSTRLRHQNHPRVAFPRHQRNCHHHHSRSQFLLRPTVRHLHRLGIHHL